jgi:tetratricopeptide (TPR) repeat protein
MPLFDGLTLSEIVLLVAGCIFFVALLIAFLWNTMHNQSVKVLMPFFAFPIVMIGFSTISIIKISDAGVEIDNQVSALQENPQNEASRKALASNLNELKGRPFANPQTVVKIASAEFALGQDTDAKRSVQKALSLDPNLKTAKDLQARMEAASKLSEATAAAEKEPAKPEIKKQLQTAVEEANKYNFANLKARQSLCTATKILKPELGAGGESVCSQWAKAIAEDR